METEYAPTSTFKDSHILIPRTCESVLLYDKGEWRLQMELMLLINRSGDYLGLSEEANKGILRSKAEAEEPEGEVTIWQSKKDQVWRC